MKLVAIDPGLMAGLFWTNGHEVHGGDANAYTTVKNLEDHFLPYPEDLEIVCERYNITSQTAKMSRQYDALEMIGAIRYLCKKYNVPLTLQSRSDRKKVSNDMLRAIGWYIPTKEGHTNEAARHCFVRFAVKYPEHRLVQKSIDTIS